MRPCTAVGDCVSRRMHARLGCAPVARLAVSLFAVASPRPQFAASPPEVTEREEVITQGVCTVSLVCESSESGLVFFNRTPGFDVALGLICQPECPEPIFNATGNLCMCMCMCVCACACACACAYACACVRSCARRGRCLRFLTFPTFRLCPSIPTPPHPHPSPVSLPPVPSPPPPHPTTAQLLHVVTDMNVELSRRFPEAAPKLAAQISSHRPALPRLRLAGA
jgi:hypothetical protein